MRRLSPAAMAAFLVATLASCGGDGSDDADDGPDLPPTEGVFDYQLGGAYAVDDLAVVVRNASAVTADGAYNICYVNGFQTQPGEFEDWDPALLITGDDGQPVLDPEWDDEYVLDPSSQEQRDGILAMIQPVIEGCAEDGYDAVEIDNLDTWTRFEQVDEDGARELASAYVDLAHDLDLAIAQKNAAEIADIGAKELGFDFAVVEECAAFEECSAYLDAYGEHVLQIEYPDTLSAAGLSFSTVCASSDRAPLTILRDRLLLTPDDAREYLYASC